MKQYILDRLKEPSTWRGIALCITAAGVALKPDQIDAIVFIGLFISGGIGAVTPDQPK